MSQFITVRSSLSKVFLGKGVLKICSKWTGEHPCRSAISIKLLCNFIEIALRHECSPLNLLHVFRTPIYENTSGRLLLNDVHSLFEYLCCNWWRQASAFPIQFNSKKLKTHVVNRARHPFTTVPQIMILILISYALATFV